MNEYQEVSWDDAREKAWSCAAPLPSELIPLASALNHRAAKDFLALCDLPRYTTSAMDGWAVTGAGPWKVVGDVKAGQPFAHSLVGSTAVRIATGAVIPDGTFGVIRWESAKEENGFIHGQVSAGLEFRPSGEECKRGEVLVARGEKLTPAMIGLLAATGYDKLEVFHQPKIALLLLGDELQLSGIPADGLVRDSLGPQLPGWIERLGGIVVDQRYVPDDLESVVAAIESAAQQCDLVVTTGGTADGPRDHVHAALARLQAHFIVDRVRSRPGHPALLARLRHPSQTLLLGLPGNPQSAIVGLMTLGAPVIATFFGQEQGPLESVATSDALRAPENFTRLVLGTIRAGRFTKGEYLGSAMLRGLAFADGFAIAASGTTEEGQIVRWLPLP